MDSEYEQSSEQHNQNNDNDQYTYKRKRLTKNQQIYGDFEEAYEPQNQPSIFVTKTHSYEQFKAGSTIERYSSQIEVDLPKTKPKPKTKQALVQQLQEELDDKPMLGQFTLNSFLNQLGGNDDLNEIEQEENEDSSQNVPVGLNDKILNHLELYKLGQEEAEEAIDIENLTYERYVQLGKPKPKHEPKYKTQQEKELAKFYKEGYGVGFKMMEKMGFKNINRGLGKNQTGTHKPVEAVMKTAFTMKDDAHNHKKKKQSQSEGEKQEEQTKQVPIPEQLFRYRSRNAKINNFLLDLQRQYQKLSSQSYFLQNEVQSMKSKTEITQSNQFQEEKCATELKNEIQKLTIISENIQKCEEYPHLGEHYQIDLLYVKRTYQKLKESNFQNMIANGETQITKLKKSLNRFYLAKSKQSLKLFEQMTAIEEKMNKRIKKGHKKEDVIDLDNLDIEDQLVLTIGVDQQEKIKKFIDLILSKTIVPIIEQSLRKADSLDRLKDLRLIDLIDLVKKIEEKTTFSKKIVKDYIYPCFQNYIRKINWSEIEKENCKVYPHLVILPWLHLLKLDEKFSLMPLYREISGRIWSIQNGVLYNIISAFFKFSTKKELNFFVHMYLSPLIFNQMQKFSINEQNLTLLQGFNKYCEFLPFSIRQDILENSLFLQIQQVHNKFVKQREEKDVKKWLKGWKKYSDKIAPGKFDAYFQQITSSN